MKEMYLNLLKDVLTYQLWEYPYIPAQIGMYSNDVRKALIEKVNKAMRSQNMQLCKQIIPNADDLIHTPNHYTMIGKAGLNNIQYCIEQVLKDGIDGDFIECGVWRGGACIYAAAVLKANNLMKNVYVADSFHGVPAPSKPEDQGMNLHNDDSLKISMDLVRTNFEIFDLLDDNIIFIPGWFKDSLPGSVRMLSVLRIDGDLYESTMDCLKALYPLLQPGGFCIIDDYFLKPCREAVQEYRFYNHIHDEMIKIDKHAAYWRKTS